jgi:hypothetical protein
MNSDPSILTTATYDRQLALIKKVGALRIRDRREIFSYIRDNSTNEATFMPYYGLTVGEFAVAQIIATENKRQ